MGYVGVAWFQIQYEVVGLRHLESFILEFIGPMNTTHQLSNTMAPKQILDSCMYMPIFYRGTFPKTPPPKIILLHQTWALFLQKSIYS